MGFDATLNYSIGLDVYGDPKPPDVSLVSLDRTGGCEQVTRTA
jgi:hypothetical protein